MKKYTALLFDFAKNERKANEEIFSILDYVEKVAITPEEKFDHSSYAFSPRENEFAKILNGATEKIIEYSYRPEKQGKSKSYINGGREGGENFSQEIKMIVNQNKYLPNSPILELRFKKNNQWTFWQGIPAKFLIVADYTMMAPGIEGVYSEITEKNLLDLKNNFQMRFSGFYQRQFTKGHLPRIYGDLKYPEMTKIIDPYTDKILFDSSNLEHLSPDKKMSVYEYFLERYDF